jgi:hypothetical protein
MNTALYTERLTSPRTTALFVALTLLCLLLGLWRYGAARLDWLAGLLFVFAAFFLFYVFNYYALCLVLTPQTFTLSFGLLHWSVPLANIQSVQPDNGLTPMQRYGGAGIHFMFVGGRYRANFNFLEHGRLVVQLKQPAGRVRDLSFSTRRPVELMQRLQAAISVLAAN